MANDLKTAAPSGAPELRILALDPGLEPYEPDLRLRMRLYRETKERLIAQTGSLQIP